MHLRAPSLLLFLCLVSAPANTAECPAGRSDQIIEVVERMASCDAAYQVFEACSYGSSMDVQIGAAVTSKCESTFLIKLSDRQRRSYDLQQARCSRKYRNKDGSMYRSFEAFCHANVVRRYARLFAPRPAPGN
jgi:hypothetical protein